MTLGGVSLDALTGWLLQTGLMVTLLLGLVLLIRHPFAKAFGSNAAYMLWLIPFCRLFVPSLTWPAAWTPARFRPEPETIAVIPQFFEPVPIESATLSAEPTSDPINWALWLIVAWATVAAVILARQFWQQFRWSSNLRQVTSPAPESLSTEFQTAMAAVGLKRTPNIRLSPDEFGPCVTGVFRPTVLLPHDFETAYSADQRHFALVHEFAHIKRGDLPASLAALIFQALNWPNPIVHWAMRAFRTDQEAACDAMVLRLTAKAPQDRENYARTLLQASRPHLSTSPTES